MGYGIALDVGTSGYRTHLVDLSKNGKIISTAITMRHPLPGANIMDHLHFWLENGADVGHKIVMDTVSHLIEVHGVDTKEIDRLAVCGNPAQVSMFEGIEIRDLAYAGQSLLKRLNVKVPDRRAKVITAGDIGLSALKPEAAVVIPPSIRHEIGADALAMIIKSKMLEEKETCMDLMEKLGTEVNSYALEMYERYPAAMEAHFGGSQRATVAAAATGIACAMATGNADFGVNGWYLSML